MIINLEPHNNNNEDYRHIPTAQQIYNYILAFQPMAAPVTPTFDVIFQNNDAGAVVAQTSVASEEIVTAVNTAIRDHIDAAMGGGNMSAAEFARVLALIIRVLIINGTSSVSRYEGVTVPATSAAGTARQAMDIPMGTIATLIRSRTTVRRYASHYAELAKRLAMTMDIDQSLLNKHGIPARFKYLCFDFAAALRNLSPEEQGVVSAAKQVAIYRSRTVNLLNASVEYTHALMPQSSAPALMGPQ